MKKLLRYIFNKFNYDIIKLNYYGTEKYKIQSGTNGLNFYDTPTGKYYLPAGARKDIVANGIKSGKYFEPEVIQLAEQYIKDGTVVLDVGANYGQMSVCFSKLNQKGTVYSFEAEPYIASILQKNVLANDCTNVKIITGAVYNETGKKLIFPEPDFIRFISYGSYGIDPNAKEGRTVESITIDSLNIAEPISFLKVDIQGSDLFALQGARETILRNKMPILFEFEEQFQAEFHTSFNDYADFVRSINYRFEKIILDINYLILPNE